MRSGKLRYQIKLQNFTTTIDDFGTPTETWADVATLRAEIVQKSTEEFIRAQGATEEEIVIFKTRYLSGVTNAMRVVFDGQPHNIREVTEDPMRRHLEIRTTTLRAN